VGKVLINCFLFINAFSIGGAGELSNLKLFKKIKKIVAEPVELW